MREDQGRARTGLSELLNDFAPARLPATLSTGLILGLVNALLGIALMSLIFSGDLTDALPIGIGVGLVASSVVGLIIALTSGFAGMYAGIQDNSAAILGLSAASIAAALVGPEAIDTVIAMMMTTTLITGAIFVLMGTFRLGDIARFVPFPVIGGLLAGTGYLILVGSLAILEVDTSVDDLTSANGLGLFWPGVALAGIFLVASLRDWPSKVYVVILLGSIVGFHIVSQLAGVDKDAALAKGWLLGPFPDGGLWPGFVAEAVFSADWAAIAGEAASLITILLLVPLTLLLYISALEVGTNSDLDLNAELKSSGWANLAGGAMGGPPGYFYLSDTLIAHRLLGGRRGPAVVGALAMFGVLLLGGTILEFLPQFVIGGLLLFVGVDFLVEWLWTARHRMTRLDYILMVGIVLTIAAIGFLPGVGAGLAAAIFLFVYRYSRIDVVKHLLTAREHQSNIERPLDHVEYLHEVGTSVVVLELQGFIFFGTANQIFDRVKKHFDAVEDLRFIVFSFRLVSGVDSSAVALFERIVLFARDHGITLVFTGLRSANQDQFAEFFRTYPDVIVEFQDLDHGMAWCEDQLLHDISHRDLPRALPDGLQERLAGYLSPRTIPEGDRLMTQGDPTPGIYLITSGTATVLLERPEAEDVRLRTLHEGTVLGEIGLYRNEPCTATVRAETDCDVLHLTPVAFEALCRDDPAGAAEFHAFVARVLASRVSHANRTIRALRS